MTISPGERRCFTIGIEDDTLAEGTEDFEIPFETAEPPHTYSKTSFLYIVDNDGNSNRLSTAKTRVDSTKFGLPQL